MKSNATGSETRVLTAYFVLAFALSWAIGVPLALANQGIIPAILPPWTHYLLAYGPMLSALIVTGFIQGLPGLRDLARRMIRWSCPKWWFVALSPLIVGYVALLIQNRFTGSRLGLAGLGAVNFLPPLGLAALPLWFFTFGLGEETGWRGFALPRLQKGRSALSATLILAAFWALWHLPQFFYVFDLSIAALGWLIGLFAGTVVLTWLYISTDSVLIVAVWHACFNFMTASTTATNLLPPVLTALVIFWAVALLRRTDPQSLVSI